MANLVETPVGADGDQAWVADLTTRTGISLHVRPARPADKADVIAFFRHVSPEDRRFRFMDTAREVGEAQVAPMLTPDGSVMTFLAFDTGGTLVACSALFDEPDGDSADVTLSVRADWKAKGVSWVLLQHVLAYAKAHGIKCVSSVESGDNHAAINLEHEMGFVARLLSADPVEVSLSKIVDEG